MPTLNPHFRFDIGTPTVISLFCRLCNVNIAWSSHPRLLLLVERIHLEIRHPDCEH